MSLQNPDPWVRPESRLPAVLAANVQRMRKSHGWSQEELARRSWLTRETIRTIEKGEHQTTLGTVELLATALGVAPVALIRESEATRAYLHAISSISEHLAVIEPAVVDLPLRAATAGR